MKLLTVQEEMELLNALRTAKEYIDEVIGCDASESDTVAFLEKKIAKFEKLLKC